MNFTVLGAGYIGKYVIRSLLNRNLSVTVLDRSDCPNEFLDKIVWIKGDFTNVEDLESALKDSTHIIHLVSSTVPSDGSTAPSEEIQSNVFSTLQLLEIMKKNNIRYLTFASSASVYGNQNIFPITEENLPMPISTHGIQKLTLEHYIRLYSMLNGYKAIIARISNPYGLGQKAQTRQGFPTIAIQAMKNHMPLRVFGGLNVTRDFIDVASVGDALVGLSLNCKETVTVNVSSNRECSLQNIANMIEKLSGVKLNITIAPKRPGDISRSILSNTKLQSLIQMKPERTPEKILLEMIETV
ncbi:NAD-dependent epimerase/dehydratase family protein [Thiotrichales bacterium 19S11-10]|nr:NAD-dependent epimerase/dehydratase family protein [Thiotrichales bacterium 19S11-10]